MSQRILALIALLFFTSVSSVRAELKIGTVDLSKIFTEFYKSKEAENRLNEARTSSRKEMDERLEHRKRLLEQIEALGRSIEDKTAAAPIREERTREREQKIQAYRELEREIEEFRRTRERQLAEQATRLRNGLVEEILRAVTEKVKKDGYDLVFDTGGQSMSNVPLLLFARDAFDFTGAILTRLNESKPKPAVAADAAATGRTERAR